MTRRQALLAIPLAPVTLATAQSLRASDDYPLPFMACWCGDAELRALSMYMRVERDGVDVSSVGWEWVDEAGGVAARLGREADGEVEIVAESGSFRLVPLADTPPDLLALYRHLRTGGTVGQWYAQGGAPLAS